jgi:hypothetical protein
MATQIVMDHTGDTRHQFDPADAAAVAKAEARFKKLTGAGFTAAKRLGEGKSEVKALALLGAWLSPTQAEQYNSYKHFEVIGSDTGTRYRIRHGRTMNVDELDSVGNRVCEWCFLPEGKLAAGDVMLAQKIALETFESQALAVANRSIGLALSHVLRVAFGILKAETGKKTLKAAIVACVNLRLLRRPYSRWHRFQST